MWHLSSTLILTLIVICFADLQSSVLHTFRLYPFLEAQPFTLWPHIWPSGFTGLREPIDIMSGKGMYRW